MTQWSHPSAVEEIAIAERIARQAHAGQKEESTGDDYIRHVERVVAMVPENAKAAAWLHDVLEDSAWTPAELLRDGITLHTIMSVLRLTRLWISDGVLSYAAYIDALQVSGDEIAIAVKIADLKDHLRPNCPASLRERYERALAALTT